MLSPVASPPRQAEGKDRSECRTLTKRKHRGLTLGFHLGIFCPAGRPGFGREQGNDTSA
jgi:hypothetical protein